MGWVARRPDAGHPLHAEQQVLDKHMPRLWDTVDADTSRGVTYQVISHFSSDLSLSVPAFPILL